jgi:DNA recombination-dependent growth factor C
MFFKNAIQYLTAQELPDLQQRKFRNPTPKELTFTGFAPVEDDLYVANGLFCLRHAEKIIPASAVKYRVEQLSAGRKVSKDELNAMKESVIREAAVHALVKVTDTYAYLGGGKLIINTASHNTAERVVSLLRALSGTFAVEKMPELDLEKMSKNPDFTIGDTATFKDAEAKVTYSGWVNQGEFEGKLRTHRLVKLSLEMGENSFTVDEKFVLSKIKMLDGDALLKPEDLRTDIALSISVANEITSALLEMTGNE